MLTIRLLGEMEVWRGEERLSLPQSRKTRALLGYLVATARSHRRERLCTLLWDVPDDPRGALRWSLSKLRALVDAPACMRIIADRDSVCFEPMGAEVDLATLRGLSAATLEAAPVERLAAIADTVRGDFLEGIELSGLVDFHTWCAAEREQVRRQHAALLGALATRIAATGGVEAALPHARMLVRLEPLDENARASLVTLLLRGGRREEARQQCDGGIRLLREADLPAPLLERLARDLRAPHRPAAWTVAPPDDPARADNADHPRQRPALHQEIRFCTTADGVRIAYATSGEGPPLLRPATWMTHLEFDWESPVWRHWLRELSREHCVIRYDGRTNGLSDREVDTLSFETLMCDLEAVVAAIGLARFPLLGISQGCAVAVAYAVRHPERVSHLVLCGGYAVGWAMRGSAEEVARRAALATLIRHGWGQDNPAFRQVFTSLFIPEATPEQMRWFNDLQRMTVSPENSYRMQRVFGDIQIQDMLAAVRTPTLVLHARHDEVVPFEQGRNLASAIPGARFVPLDSRNHLLLESEPAWPRFLQETRAFLASTPE